MDIAICLVGFGLLLAGLWFGGSYFARSHRQAREEYRRRQQGLVSTTQRPRF